MRIVKLIKIVFNSILESVEAIKQHRTSSGIKGR